MKNKKRSVCVKMLALLLVCVLVVSGEAFAALPETAETQANDYLED